MKFRELLEGSFTSVEGSNAISIFHVTRQICGNDNEDDSIKDMAETQLKLIVPDQPEKASCLDVEQPTLFSEVYLTEAFARLKTQTTQRHRSSKASIESLPRTLNARVGLGPDNRRQRVRSPRTQASRAQASRSNSTSASQGIGLPLLRDHNIDQFGKAEQEESGRSVSQHTVSTVGKGNRIPEQNLNAGVGQKIDKFEKLAILPEASLDAETSKSTEEVTDVTESASIPVKQIFKPRKLDISRSEPLWHRPSSIAKIPIELYHDELELITEDKKDSLTDSSMKNPGERKSRLSLPSTLASAPGKSAEGQEFDVTALPLRSGSVLTFIQPERTAWQRSVYIQGPIELRNPNGLGRKGSIASIYTFQDAVEQGLDRNSSFSRRSSDEESIDDIIGFFESLGIEPEFHESDLSSLRYRKLSMELVPESVEIPDLEEHTCSNMFSGQEVASHQHLGGIEKKNRAADDAAASPASPGPGGPKRFPSLSKKRPYKRTKFDRLTSII